MSYEAHFDVAGCVNKREVVLSSFTRDIVIWQLLGSSRCTVLSSACWALFWRLDVTDILPELPVGLHDMLLIEVHFCNKYECIMWPVSRHLCIWKRNELKNIRICFWPGPRQVAEQGVFCKWKAESELLSEEYNLSGSTSHIASWWAELEVRWTKTRTSLAFFSPRNASIRFTAALSRSVAVLRWIFKERGCFTSD